jgi:hypothetical protein
MDSSLPGGRVGAAVAAALATWIATRPAHAQACNTLPSPVYGVGGSAPTQLFAKLGKALSAATPPQTIVYQSPGACLGPQYLLDGTTMTGTATYWNAAGTALSCSLPLTGQVPDFGAGGTYASFCPGVPSPVPATLGDFLGPIEVFDFIVPKASSQTVISAPAAYFVYGFGAQSQAAPWTVPSEIIKRNANSAAAILISLAINVPVADFQGVDGVSNAGSVTDVASAATPENAIGFASNETVATSLSSVNVLAYQHYNQTCGYWPSSTQAGFDMQNVRNGHYPLWSSLHFYATTNASGAVTDAAAAQLIGYFTHTVTPPAGVDVDALAAQVGEVLDCAMEVKRASDFGTLEPYAPAAPCGCFFEENATGSTTCTACTTDAGCPASATHCRMGYCEVN